MDNKATAIGSNQSVSKSFGSFGHKLGITITRDAKSLSWNQHNFSNSKILNWARNTPFKKSNRKSRHQEVGEWSLEKCRDSIMELAKELNRVMKNSAIPTIEFSEDICSLEECRCFMKKWADELDKLYPNLKQSRSPGQVERREGAQLRIKEEEELGELSEREELREEEEEEEQTLKIAYDIIMELAWKLKSELENSVSAEEDVEQRLSELVKEWKQGQLKNILPVLEFIMWELMKGKIVKEIVCSVQKTGWIWTYNQSAEPQADVLTLYLELDEALIADPSAAESDSGSPAQPPFYTDNMNLKWVQWNGTLPKDTVCIYNKHFSREDYVARVRGEQSPGFYTPSKGSYCYYSMSDKEERTSDFELLVNEDNFELLQWNKGSLGIMPDYSVRTTSEGTVFVGKNKYGLGKVVPQFRALFLPHDGKELCVNINYKVLCFIPELYSQKISNVQYRLEEMKLTQNPEREIPPYYLYNNNDQPILKTVTSQVCVPVHKMWDIGRPTRADAITTITAQIPVINLKVDKSDSLSPVKELNCTQGTALSETETRELRFEVTMAPRSRTTVPFEAKRVTVEIPFTAQLSRSYRNSQTCHTFISGVYRAFHISEVKPVGDVGGPCLSDQNCRAILKKENNC